MEARYPTPDGVDLEIRIPSGSIEVRCEPRGDTAIEIRGERDPDDVRVDRTERPGGRTLILIERRNRKMFGFGRELTVWIQAPEGAVVDASTGSADLAIRGNSGSVAFRSGSGEMTFERASGAVDIKVASGDVTGERIDGDLAAHSASGEIRVRSVGGTATANTASGDITIGSVGGSVIANSASGDVRIGSVEAGSVRARTMSGDVAVGVARGTRVWLDLSSVSGDTVSELDPGDGGDGGTATELHLSSVSGDIRVHRATARP
jgi:DUF4097 and DUF4098 domain-containing protein YvlB